MYGEAFDREYKSLPQRHLGSSSEIDSAEAAEPSHDKLEDAFLE